MSKDKCPHGKRKDKYCKKCTLEKEKRIKSGKG